MIPGDLTDLSQLQLNDICTASGTGSLTVSGGVQVTASPNPLASVNLPLNAGSVTVQEGAMAGLTVSFGSPAPTRSGSRRLDTNIIELSFLKEKGTTLKTDLTGSAGITAMKGDKDLIAKLLGRD